ncbi:uncharacterized protein I303_106297 [Kwoniella dejecticola CBS 10117]|uniref:Methyltransferase type 11 domain-containing protein n=1 Tax=Kwoniella dejecticola CBS 10117 TaxID=1296121 RepID=A0A1A6A1U9_9TREE|nr:uncharacterized protein I303_06317 [Kwoniella dejecticola CBS 10117]OBR84030.1 hypothetical protein I303_06317 [Kwoniella dejecticola CBS 10117]
MSPSSELREAEAGPSNPPSKSKSKKSKEKPPKVDKPKPQVAAKPKPKPKPVPVGPFDKPDEEEEKNVHEVYEAIAGHFSQTRHKPWPFIEKFLHSLPANSIGLDSGAGNGKYLPSSRDAKLEMIALDRSSGLLEIARNENGGECVRGDLGFRGWRDGVFDFAISIAAIHHLSTPERRRHAVKSVMRPLKLSSSGSYSKFMIYVWAYEQGTLSKRRMGTLTNSSPTSTPIPKESHPATTSSEGDPKANPTSDSQNQENDTKQSVGAEDGVKEIEEKIQDLLVPWVYSKPPAKAGATPNPDSQSASQTSTQGQSQGHRQTQAQAQADSQQENRSEPIVGAAPEEPKVYHRYYHLFIEGELREMVVQAAKEEGFEIVPDGNESDPLETHLAELKLRGRKKDDGSGKKWLRVRGVGWEADNWWIECEVGKI